MRTSLYVVIGIGIAAASLFAAIVLIGVSTPQPVQRVPSITEIQSSCEKYEPATAEQCQMREMSRFIDKAQASREKSVDDDLNNRH